jgi:hypothetical protein
MTSRFYAPGLAARGCTFAPPEARRRRDARRRSCCTGSSSRAVTRSPPPRTLAPAQSAGVSSHAAHLPHGLASSYRYTLRAIFARGWASGVWALPGTAKNIRVSPQRTNQEVAATVPMVNPQDKPAHAPSMLHGARGPVPPGPGTDARAGGALRSGDGAERPRPGAGLPRARCAGNPAAARVARTPTAEGAAVRRAGKGGTTGRRLRR